MRNLSLLCMVLFALVTSLAAQTPPPSNEYFLFDGSVDQLARFTAKEDGLYMVYRPELCRGLKTIEDWTFVVDDLNHTATPQESVTLEVRKATADNLPGVTAADLIWRGKLTIDFSKTPTPGIAALTVTPFTKIQIPSTEAPFYVGFHWPAMTVTTDGMCVRASGPTTSNACMEVPRDESQFKGELCAGIDFTPLTGSVGYTVSNIALCSWVTFTEPVVQGFANNYGYITTGAINFCTYNSPTQSFIAAPKNAPTDNFGYAGVWPDVNDFLKQGRKDKFGFRVMANQYAPTGGGVAILFFSDNTFDPGFIQTTWDTLYLSPLSRWFAIATLIMPLKVDLAATPPSAIATFGPWDLSPISSLWVSNVGPLHVQAVIADPKNPNNIQFSNMTTMNFDWIGKTSGQLDATTPNKTVPMPVIGGYKKAMVHSLRGNLVIQAEYKGNPIGPIWTVACGGTKTVLAVPSNGGVKISLDPKSTEALFDINFLK